MSDLLDQVAERHAPRIVYPTWNGETEESQDLTIEDVMADVGDEDYPSRRYPQAFTNLRNGVDPEFRQRQYRARQREDIKNAWAVLKYAIKDWLKHRSYHPLNGR